jgi:prepilin-type N-terminal cleavage/methylation domain-containing protein
MRSSTRQTRQGFTLIEILAVVFIIGMMMTLVFPSLSGVRSAALREAATSLAGTLEMARQSAVMSGKPHRVLVDVEAASYRVEWFVSEDGARGIDSTFDQPELDLRGMGPLPLSPPTANFVDYRPVPNKLGSSHQLDAALHFEGIDTPDGWLDDGMVAIVFQRDGSTEAVEIDIADDDEGRISLVVEPWLDHIRIFYDAD